MIRSARLEDVGAIKAFADAIHEEQFPYFRHDASGVVSADAIRQAICQAEAGADRCGLVAEEPGQIIGTVECRPLLEPVSGLTHEVAISVRHDWRGRGVGGLLLDRALIWARGDARVAGLCGEVAATNTDSIRLVGSRNFWKARWWPGHPKEMDVAGQGVPILVYCRETPGT